MKKTKAILFDLCDTLFLFDPQRLPAVQVRGQEIRSTTGIVHQVLAMHTTLPFEAFYDAFVRTTQEIVQDREQDHHEVTSEERFQRLLNCLELWPGKVSAAVLIQMVLTHMEALAAALHLPPSHKALVQKIRGRYPIGIITNFDHAPTVHQILVREGLHHLVEPVVISAEVGWRKPRPEIFQRALDLLGMDGREVLFVGNDLKIDVAGAQTMGIPVVWFNRHNEAPSPRLPKPDYILSRLEELQNIL